MTHNTLWQGVRRRWWTSHCYCSATNANQIIGAKHPNSASTHRPFIDEFVTIGVNASSVLTQVSIPAQLELKVLLASVCILKFWECLPLAVSIFSCYADNIFHKPSLINQKRKWGFGSYFVGDYICRKMFSSCSVAHDAIWEVLLFYSCNSYVTIKQRKEPQWRLFR